MQIVAKPGPKPTSNCRVCGDFLVLGTNIPISRFNRNPICSPCHSVNTRRWEQRNIDKAKEGNRIRNRRLNAKPERIRYYADRYTAAGHRAKVGGSEGYLYAINNPAWPGFFKIGKAYSLYRRLSNYQTGTPNQDYAIHDAIKVHDRHLAERIAHEYLNEYRHANEWFECSDATVAACLFHVRTRIPEGLQ